MYKLLFGKFFYLYFMKPLIISGSARRDGNTKILTEELIRLSSWNIVDLNDYDFSYYDYEHRNRHDDFLKLMRDIISKRDTLIFVTPVYWYSMSGIMKVFFDRLTDLLTIEKELGRKLRGKKVGALSCSAGDNLGEYFWLPFSKTCEYLGMEYLAHAHTVAGERSTEKLQKFIRKFSAIQKDGFQ